MAADKAYILYFFIITNHDNMFYADCIRFHTSL